jgi:hypothetical protein
LITDARPLETRLVTHQRIKFTVAQTIFLDPSLKLGVVDQAVFLPKCLFRFSSTLVTDGHSQPFRLANGKEPLQRRQAMLFILVAFESQLIQYCL